MSGQRGIYNDLKKVRKKAEGREGGVENGGRDGYLALDCMYLFAKGKGRLKAGKKRGTAKQEANLSDGQVKRI